MEAVESAGRLSGLPPRLGGQYENDRPRDIAGHVGLDQGFQPPGETFVIIGKQCPLKKPIKVLTCHMRHIAERTERGSASSAQ
ncbi:hypothetical protein Pta02_42290 [Planobispora takensis]|uniref:Uncharacterized protein n=1 Tax=Planobispora takensis TaxID=1367882 RepID=A0A8J3T0K2_9ACTN|nr:hypothetical protein Pta02_42290 [Planobispora takensis]